MIEIKSYTEFLNIIYNNPNIYLFIDYYAPWCKPCLKALPVIEQLEAGVNISHLKFYKINIDENCECVDNLNIQSIPKFSLYLNGEEIQSVNGFNLESIGNMLTNNIKK